MTETISPPNPSGLCMCGCGEYTPLATASRADRQHVKGQPVRFIQGHNNRVRTKKTGHPKFSPEETANISGLCMCGCGQPTPIAKDTYSRMGRFKGLPTRYLQGHSWIKGTVSPLAITKVYDIDPDTGCWNWLLYKNPKGYGRWAIGSHKGTAHRIMYEDLIGPVPAGLSLDHLCGNTGCVNPYHLEPVTLRENSKRKVDISCLSLNFIVIRAMNAFKDFTASLRSQTA